VKVFINITSITFILSDLESNFNHNMIKPKYPCIEKINKMYDNGDEIVYWIPKELNGEIDWEDFMFKKLMEWGCSFNDITCESKESLLDLNVGGEITIIEEI